MYKTFMKPKKHKKPFILKKRSKPTQYIIFIYIFIYYYY
ncbi:hypothetical protein LCGC14_2185330, partial [marine sediment metagenome]